MAAFHLFRQFDGQWPHLDNGHALLALRNLVEILEEKPRPGGAVLFPEPALHHVDAFSPFVVRHLQGPVQRGGHVIDIVGVYLDRVGKFLRRSGKLAQDQDARAFGKFRPLAVEKFLRHEIHAVAQRSHEADLRQRVERRQILDGKSTMKELHRRVAESAKLTVDRPDLPLHLLGQLVIFGDSLPRRNGDQHEQHLVPLLRVDLKESPHRRKLGRQSLGVVQALDTKDKSLSTKILGVFFKYFRKRLSCHGPLESSVVVADGIDAQMHFAAIVPEALHVGFPTQHPQDRGAEMPEVIVGVEADHIGPEHAFQDFTAVGKHAENLAGAKWSVQEKTDFQALVLPPQHRGDEEKMVVVDPHLIAIVGHFHDHIRELLVHRAVGFPPIIGKPGPLHHVMQERPEGGIRVALVKSIDFLPRQEHGNHSGASHFRSDLLNIVEILRRLTRPPDPEWLHLQGRPLKRGGQSSRRPRR